MSDVVIQNTELGKSCRLSAVEPSCALDRIAEYDELAWRQSCAAEVLRSLEGPPRRDQARAPDQDGAAADHPLVQAAAQVARGHVLLDQGDYPEGQKVLARGRKLAQGARLFNFGVSRSRARVPGRGALQALVGGGRGDVGYGILVQLLEPPVSQAASSRRAPG